MWWWRKSQELAKVRRIHHVGTINVCTNFCNNPSCSCWTISQKKGKVWSVSGERSGVRESIKLSGFILWGPWIFTADFIAFNAAPFSAFTSYYITFRHLAGAFIQRNLHVRIYFSLEKSGGPTDRCANLKAMQATRAAKKHIKRKTTTRGKGARQKEWLGVCWPAHFRVC